MLHAGLDLSRKRLDVCLITEDGEIAGRVAVPPDADGLRGLVRRIAPCGEPVRAVIESMTGARFVHDTLEELGWEVLIADAQKVKGLPPLACKTDMIDAQVLAVLSHRDLVPAIWLPDPRVRREREQARFRLHLVKHKSSLKSRIHSTMITFGHPCPVTDLFGVAGRELLDRLEVPQPWRGTIDASLCTPCAIRPTTSATRATSSGWANSAAPRSPRSTSPESSPKRSGTCSPTTNPSHPRPLREAPLFVWPPDGPSGLAPSEPASNVAWSSRRGGTREMSAARHPQHDRGP
jgi:hypothetical protein